MGLVLATNPVYVNGQMASRKGEYFWRELSVNNATAPVWQQVTVTATGETPVTGNVFVPRTPELFSYDLDGNMTTDGRRNYTWDAENRLIRVQSRSDTPQASWRRVEWQYDALGRRIRQTTWMWNTSSGTWQVTEDLKFISDPLLFGRHIAELRVSDNALVRTYVWGLDLSETLEGVGGLLWVTLYTAFGSVVGTHFAAYDGNGNVVGLVSSTAGTETARYEYGPFGEPIRVSGLAATLNPFRFSTKRTCNTTDLVLYEYRAYSPCLGRWMSRDPVEETGGGNLYGFVFGNPLNNFDRLGLSAGKCREAIGKKGKPRIVFEYSPPKGGWRGKLGFGDVLGSAQAQMVHKIYIRWEAAVAVLCICPTGCEIRYGTRIQEDEEHGNWLVYDPTKLPQSPFPVPQSIWEIIGQLIADGILELLGPAPVPMDDNELERMKAAIMALLDRRPKCPWDGSWKGGKSPCDG